MTKPSIREEPISRIRAFEVLTGELMENKEEQMGAFVVGDYICRWKRDRKAVHKFTEGDFSVADF